MVKTEFKKTFFMSVVSTETLIVGQTEQEHEKCDIYRLVHRGSVLNLFLLPSKFNSVLIDMLYAL